MIFLRLGDGGGRRRNWVGVLLLGLGILIIVSGLALLAIIGIAAAVIGVGVLLFRRLTAPARSSPRDRDGPRLELDPDFEIFPAQPSDGAEHAGSDHPRVSAPDPDRR